MSLLSNLTTSTDIEESGDSTGGKFDPVPSALYQLKINSAYLRVAESEALGLQVEVETNDGRTVRETFWVTSGKAKGKKNYYMTKDNTKAYLPGFNTANALCLLAVGKELSNMETEEKIVDIYDPKVKAAVPTKVEMLVELLDKPILAGILQVKLDKTIRDEESGKYVPTGETRIANEIDKFFRAKDQMTVTEIKSGAESAAFCEKWNNKWGGVVKDKTDKKTPPATKAAPAAAPKAANLFA